MALVIIGLPFQLAWLRARVANRTNDLVTEIEQTRQRMPVLAQVVLGRFRGAETVERPDVESYPADGRQGMLGGGKKRVDARVGRSDECVCRLTNGCMIAGADDSAAARGRGPSPASRTLARAALETPLRDLASAYETTCKTSGCVPASRECRHHLKMEKMTATKAKGTEENGRDH